MKFLYPCDPNNTKHVDQNFQEEYDTIIHAGYEVVLFDFDRFIAGDLNIIAKIKDHRLLYRGWMMNEAQYDSFIELITKCGGTLITSKHEYLRTHHLPFWYPLCKDFTATTLTFKEDELDNLSLFCRNGRKKWFVKDYVKSNTGSAGSIAKNLTQLQEIAKEIKLYRGEIEGGICLRKYENYLSDTEVRLFVYRGVIYCDNTTYGRRRPDFIEEIVKHIESPFYTIDITRRRNNTWRLVELGDGQVSSLKDFPIEIFGILVDDIYERERNIERELELLQGEAVTYINHNWNDADANLKLHDEFPELYESHHCALGKEPDEAYLNDLFNSSGKFNEIDKNTTVNVHNKIKQFENLMNPILDIIYENEQHFIDTFLSEHRGYELTGVDFSPEQVKYNVLCYSGMHATCSEPLEHVLQWCERVIK